MDGFGKIKSGKNTVKSGIKPFSIRTFIKGETKGWKSWEVAWLLIACAAIAILSVYWHDTIIGIISATTGVACVVCTGKGKLSAYIFGTVNVVLYAIISFRAHYYGEVMLNLIYYLPMEFYGFYVWNKHINKETYEVKKRHMTSKGRRILIIIVGLSTVGYGAILKVIGGTLPFADALSTVVSVVAMMISVKRYMEQWILWIVVDVVTVFMWINAFINGNDSIATLLMWIVYLGNAVIMYIKWTREAKQNEV